MSTALANISIKRELYSVSTLSPMIGSLAKYQNQMGLLLLFIISVTILNLFFLFEICKALIGRIFIKVILSETNSTVRLNLIDRIMQNKLTNNFWVH